MNESTNETTRKPAPQTFAVTYVPKDVAREVFAKSIHAVVLPHLDFDSAWAQIGEMDTDGETIGALTEAEYRRGIAGLVRTLNAVHLHRLAEEEADAAVTLRDAFFLEVSDRIGDKRFPDILFVPATGIVNGVRPAPPASRPTSVKRR